jgi:hypothetical protein
MLGFDVIGNRRVEDALAAVGIIGRPVALIVKEDAHRAIIGVLGRQALLCVLDAAV